MTTISVTVEQVENGYILTSPVFIETIVGPEKTEPRRRIYKSIEEMFYGLLYTFRHGYGKNVSSKCVKIIDAGDGDEG